MVQTNEFLHALLNNPERCSEKTAAPADIVFLQLTLTAMFLASC